jgi:hypothetical protein
MKIVHEKHYKFAPQKVTIATDRSRKSCVFFNIVDWFIHSRQNNKLLSDANVGNEIKNDSNSRLLK